MGALILIKCDINSTSRENRSICGTLQNILKHTALKHVHVCGIVSQGTAM